MEQKLDTLSTTLQNMHQMMVAKGIFDEEESHQDKPRGKKAKQLDEGIQEETDRDSETTIYKNAVKKAKPRQEKIEFNVDHEVSFNYKNKNDSSSSDERIDTSDELMEIDDHEINVDLSDQFIADCATEARANRDKQGNGERTTKDKESRRMTGEISRSEQVIWDAKTAKARLLATPGNLNSQLFDANNHWQQSIGSIQSTNMDENYLVIRNQVEASIQQKSLVMNTLILQG